MRPVRIMLRRVEWRRDSRWRSFGPGEGISMSAPLWVGRIDMAHTSNTSSRPNIDFYCCFLWLFIASQHLDWAIDCANDAVAVVCVCRRAVGAVQVSECDFWDSHCVCIQCCNCLRARCVCWSRRSPKFRWGRCKLRSMRGWSLPCAEVHHPGLELERCLPASNAKHIVLLHTH
jgi:hypothetical protein